MLHFLTGIFHADSISDWKTVAWIKGFAIFMDNIFLPVLIVSVVVGIIWVVVAGVKMTTLRTEEAIQHQKRYVIHVAVGVGLFMLFLFLITFLSVKLPSFIEG